MKVQEIMTTPAVFIGPEDTVEDASCVMQCHNIGSVPVADASNSVVGIVTDRDIIIRTIANGKNPKDTKVKDIMTTKVETVSSDDSIKDLFKKMTKRKVRRLPVVDNGALIGMVALGDMSVNSSTYMEASEALCEISEGCHHK